MPLNTPPNDPTRDGDDQLMLRIAQGDAAAFETIYDRHSSRAYSLAYRLLGDRDSAEDLVQDAFLTLWRHADAYDANRGSVGAWLLSITHRRGVDRLRTVGAMQRRQQALQAIHATAEPGEDAADAGLARILADGVRGELAELPEEQGQVVRLAYYGGFTHHEIADLLGLPLGTVKGRIRLGLERLRRGMGMVEGT